MVGGINNNGAMHQMHQMRQGQGAGAGQGMHKGQGMGQLMQSLPQEDRQNLQQTLQSMDETQRKDVVSQLKELDVANMSQDELTKQIQDIINPNSSTSQTTSSLTGSFSVYA